MANSPESPNPIASPNPENYLRERGYTNFEKIETGGQGTVYKCLKGDHHVAVKIVRVEFPNENKMGEDLQRELTIMSKLRHPNMIRINEILRTKTKVYIFMEYASNGTIATIVRNNGPISEWNAKVWFCPIARALKYLHDNKVAHRDIKLDNILLDEHMNPKLTDFGFSRFVNVDSFTHKVALSKTHCGTPSYYPPELLKRQPYDPFKADIWCLGICLFAMINQDYPFDKDYENKMYNDQLKQRWRWRSKVQSIISSDMKDLLKHLLDPNVKTRYNANDVCKHQWFPIDDRV